MLPEIPDSELKLIRRIEKDKLYEYMERSLCVPPWEGFKGRLSERMDEWLNYFYWLFGGWIKETNGVYISEPQYLPGVSRYITEYVKKYGEFMDSSESWKPEYYALVAEDERFRINDYFGDGQFDTFNDFFVRDPKPWKRPIGEGLISPCDGVIQNVLSVIGGKARVKVKTTQYHDLSMLLARETKITDGSLIDIYLNVFDCHRVYCPMDADVVSITKIPGGNYVGGFVEYLNGHYVLDSSEYGWQSIETRTVIELVSKKYGLFYLVMVGMSHIGSVEVSIKPNDHIGKGDEVGMFKFGGSGIILVLQDKEVSIKRRHYLARETIIKGEGWDGDTLHV
jgi:phosphatidylserine decarboxylase